MTLRQWVAGWAHSASVDTAVLAEIPLLSCRNPPQPKVRPSEKKLVRAAGDLGAHLLVTGENGPFVDQRWRQPRNQALRGRQMLLVWY